MHEWGCNLFCRYPSIIEIETYPDKIQSTFILVISPEMMESFACTYHHLPGFIQRCNNHKTVQYTKTNSTASFDMMRLIKKIQLKENDRGTIALEEATDILTGYLDIVRISPATKNEKLKQPEVEKVYEVKKFLLSNMNKKLIGSDLIKKFKIRTPYFLSKNFKEVYGLTAFELLHLYRMDKAIDLLKQQIPQKQIAGLLGYKTPQAFIKEFTKSHGGISPAGYSS